MVDQRASSLVPGTPVGGLIFPRAKPDPLTILAFLLANWMLRMVHTKSESFWFLGQIDCSGWLFSGLQSKLPLSLRNLMLRRQLAEHDASPWMKIGLLSLSKVPYR